MMRINIDNRMIAPINSPIEGLFLLKRISLQVCFICKNRDMSYFDAMFDILSIKIVSMF